MSFVRLLSQLYGDRFSTDKSILKLYWRDYWPLLVLKELQNKPHTMPLGVLWPESAEEVSNVLKLSNKYKFKIVPYAGGSGVNGAIIGENNIIIDIRKMNKILSLNEDDLTVIVESGIYIKELEEYLNHKGYTLRHFPQSYPEAVVGGLISTFSTGQYSTKYGGIEDIVLNLEIVTPYGDITWLRKNTVPRSASGPDLKRLFIGAEGQFGIITKAVLKIRPLPNYIWRNTFLCDDFSKANYAIKKLLVNNIVPALVRIYDKQDSLIRFSEDSNVMLIVIEEYDEDMFNLIVEKVKAYLSNENCINAKSKYVDEWFKKRFDITSELVKYLIPMDLWFDTIETATTWSNLPRLYTSVKAKLMDLEGVLSVLAHTSHFYLNGMCIYFTIIFKQNIDLYWDIWNIALNNILKEGGTITHHHGIGRLKYKWVPNELLGAFSILKKIKDILDKNRVLNSGGWL